MSIEVRSITVPIQCTVSGGEGHLTAEIDSRAWGNNSGRSVYYAGDSCYFLVYISKNVDIVGVTCAGGARAMVGPTGDGLYNVQHEGVTFNTPVAEIGKPADSINVLSSTFVGCGEPKLVTGTKVIRLSKWQSSLSPAQIPPYGYMYVEYAPIYRVGVVSGLCFPPDVPGTSFTNTVVIFGVAKPSL